MIAFSILIILRQTLNSKEYFNENKTPTISETKVNTLAQ